MFHAKEHNWAKTIKEKGALVYPPASMHGYMTLQCKEAKLKGPQTYLHAKGNLPGKLNLVAEDNLGQE